MWHKCDTNVTQMWHKCDINVTQMWHKCDTNVTQAWQVGMRIRRHMTHGGTYSLQSETPGDNMWHVWHMECKMWHQADMWHMWHKWHNVWYMWLNVYHKWHTGALPSGMWWWLGWASELVTNGLVGRQHRHQLAAGCGSVGRFGSMEVGDHLGGWLARGQWAFSASGMPAMISVSIWERGSDDLGDDLGWPGMIWDDLGDLRHGLLSVGGRLLVLRVRHGEEVLKLPL